RSAGIEWRRRQGMHGIEIALQPLTDRLAFAAQPVALALAALLFQPGVECLPCRKLRDRDHEVAPGVTDQSFDAALVIALSRTTVAIADQVMGQKPAKQGRPLARAIRQDLRHKATVVVVDNRLRHGPEESERM